jgi:ACS family glucarate transporter-like MFS transporter
MFVLIGSASVICIAATVFAPDLLTAVAVFAVMFGAQFLMGVAQAPTFPVSTGVFETWFPPSRWPLVQGLQTMGLGFGGALAPPLIATLMAMLGWQRALLWTAIPAIPLYLLWAWYARNTPREHASVSADELALLSDATSEQANARVSLREMAAILRDRHVLLLTFAYFCMNYLFYLLGNWCFLYLVQERHFSVLESGWLATAPPIAAGVGAGIGGYVASYLYVRLGIRRGLRLTPLMAMPAAGVLMLLAVHAGSAYLAIMLLAFCYGLVELTEGSFWAAAMTIGRRNTMAVGGVMNTGGSLGGVVGIPIVAYLSGHGDWNTAFFIGTGFAIVTAVTWLFIDASHVAAEPGGPSG